ncbi:MAG: hypothetical protein ACXV8P_07680 [Methylobacter sp.]
MKNNKEIISLVTMCLTLAISGCATQANTAYQSVTVSSIETATKTVCTLKNEEGEWKTLANIPVSIHRDGNPMAVNCENTTTKGERTVVPEFEGGYLAMDIMLVDLCLVSCIIDGANNAFYQYPEIITVPMAKK